MNNKKWLMAVALLCCASMLVMAGGDAESEGATAGGFNATGYPIVDELTELSVFVGGHATIEDLNTNSFTQWYQEKTNIKLNFVEAPTDTDNKLNLILSSGTDVPDMLLRLNIQQALNYGTQGILVPLNELIDSYGANFSKISATRPHLSNIVTAPDGNIYAMPGLNECWHCEYTPKAFVAKNWMEKLGLDMPETTDDLVDLLRAFKEQDPNGNGKQDEIPMTGTDKWWQAEIDEFLMMPFTYYPGRTKLWIEDGKIYAPFTTDGWRQGVLYMRGLYAEGLIDSEVFTQDGTQFSQLIENDPMIVGAWTAGWAGAANPNGERIMDYDAVIPPLKGPDGIRRSSHNPSWYQGLRFAITNECNNPEAAFRWADGFYDMEIQIRKFYGPKDVGWREALPGEMGLNKKQADFKLLIEWGTPNNVRWDDLGLTVTTAEWRGTEAMVDSPGTYPGQRLSTERSMPYVGFEPDDYLPPLIMTVEEAEQTADLKTSIDNYVKEHFVRFVTGDLDIEGEWDEYLEELDKLNLAAYIELTQKVYDRQWKGFDFSKIGTFPY